MRAHQSRLLSTLNSFLAIVIFTAALFFIIAPSFAEPLRIAYTSIAMVYGPLWLTKEAGIFKKYNIEPELLYIAGGPPSLQALIAGDVAVSFTAAGAVVAANLSGSEDRKSTRLNSSHRTISYAVFCLKKKTKKKMYEPVIIYFIKYM